MRLLRSDHAGLLACGAAVVLTFATLAGATPAAHGAAGGRVPITGFLLSASGEPLSSATVRLFAEQKDVADRSTREVSLGAVSTAPDGRFELTVAAGSLPMDASGGSELGLFAFTGTGKVSFYTNIRVLQDPRSGTWSPDQPADALEVTEHGQPLGAVYQVGHGLLTDSVAARRTAAPLLARVGAGSAFGAFARGQVLRAPADERQAASPGPAVPASPSVRGLTTQARVVPQETPRQQACLQNGWIAWKGTGHSKYVMVPTKLFQNTGRAQTEWDLEDTKETTLGVAIDNAGSFYAGGLSASYTNLTGLDFKPIVPVDERRMFKLKWQYVQEQLWCSDDGLPPGNIMSYDIYRWIPWQATSGNLTTKTTKSTQCGGDGQKFHDPYSQETGIEKGSTATYGGFFSISGIGLNVEQKTMNAEKFIVLPLRGQTAHLCGDNAGPAFASYAKEIDPR